MWIVSEQILTTKPQIINYNYDNIKTAEKVYHRLINNWKTKFRKYDIHVLLYEGSRILKEKILSRSTEY